MTKEYGVRKNITDFPPSTERGIVEHKLIKYFDEDGFLLVERIFNKGGLPDEPENWRLGELGPGPAEFFYDNKQRLVETRHYEGGRLEQINLYDPKTGHLYYQEYCNRDGPSRIPRHGPAIIHFNRKAGEETERQFWWRGKRVEDPNAKPVNEPTNG
jgi:hypothetical protein